MDLGVIHDYCLSNVPNIFLGRWSSADFKEIRPCFFDNKIIYADKFNSFSLLKQRLRLREALSFSLLSKDKQITDKVNFLIFVFLELGFVIQNAYFWRMNLVY